MGEERRYILERFERLIDIGIALSVEKDTQGLLERILLEAKRITNADGGTLYSVQEDNTARMEIVRTDSLHFAMGGTTGEPIPFPPIPLFTQNGEPNDHNVVTYAVLHDRTINIPDAYNADGFDFSGTRKFDRKTGYRSQSFLTVPMKNHAGDITGVLQLLNAQDETDGQVVPFDLEAQRLVEALASLAAVSLTNKRLTDNLTELLESFIHLIASAIDEKSPYTGGHCRRVPVITMLLADAVDKVKEGPLAGFNMDEEDRYELEIAAWLHDCGKITTPEHVVDKATKLETIYDRIHTVDSRLEILRRDARLEHQAAELAAYRRGETPDTQGLERTYQERLAELDEIQRYLHQYNYGSEWMTEAERAQVRAYAQCQWRDHHGQLQPLLTADEVNNLTIPKGTLTEAERTVINNHIVTTINMLESLPFPKHLRNIPAYAGGHHERIDGRGYPKGLTAEQMPVQARVMAIADIFEALTARDRPYKRSKTLSEALTILGKMAEEGHVDPDLYRVFIHRGVYLEYAEAYLDEEQIDTVDIQALPGFADGS